MKEQEDLNAFRRSLTHAIPWPVTSVKRISRWMLLIEVDTDGDPRGFGMTMQFVVSAGKASDDPLLIRLLARQIATEGSRILDNNAATRQETVH